MAAKKMTSAEHLAAVEEWIESLPDEVEDDGEVINLLADKIAALNLMKPFKNQVVKLRKLSK